MHTASDTSTPAGQRRPGRRLLAVAAAVAAANLAVLVADSADAATPPAPAGLALVFSDDFTGAANTGVDRTNWLYATGTGYPGGATSWGTDEIETMTDSTANVYHDGAGHLAIKPIRDAAGRWTSGRIETQRTDFAAPPGGKVRIQASLRQPDVSGEAAAGYWSAFWTLGAAARPVGATNWPSVGEWDVMEAVNGHGSTFGTVHCGLVSGGPCNEPVGLGSGEHPCLGCQSDFHEYAVEHDRSSSPEQLRWYLDGELYHTVHAGQMDEATWKNATHHGMFIILNVAIGGVFPAAFGGGPTAVTTSGVPMLVDYVAVYQSTGDARDAYGQIEAESYDAAAGVVREASSEGVQHVGALTNGDWVRFDNVDFGTGGVRDFVARVASGADRGIGGLIEVRVGSRDNAPIGSIAVSSTGGWQSWRSVPGNVSNVAGRQTVFLTFTSGQPADFANIDWIQFRH